MQMVLIPRAAFSELEPDEPSAEAEQAWRERVASPASLGICTVFTETSDVWINVTDLLFFSPKSTMAAARFIIASEHTGFRHLYAVSADAHSAPVL